MSPQLFRVAMLYLSDSRGRSIDRKVVWNRASSAARNARLHAHAMGHIISDATLACILHYMEQRCDYRCASCFEPNSIDSEMARWKNRFRRFDATWCPRDVTTLIDAVDLCSRYFCDGCVLATLHDLSGMPSLTAADIRPMSPEQVRDKRRSRLVVCQYDNSVSLGKFEVVVGLHLRPGERENLRTRNMMRNISPIQTIARKRFRYDDRHGLFELRLDGGGRRILIDTYENFVRALDRMDREAGELERAKRQRTK